MTTQTPIPSSSCETPQDEYWYHVASQEEMPLAGSTRAPLALGKLDQLFPADNRYVPDTITEADITDWIIGDPTVALELRLVLSIADKRFYLDLSYLFSRERVSEDSDQTICGCLPNTMRKHSTNAILGYVSRGAQERRQRAAEIIAKYLTSRGLLVVLNLYFGLNVTQRLAVNDAWLSPHNAQQNETKRRGHGAEAEIAQAFIDAGITVYPPDKATNPMGSPDPNVSLADFTISPRVPGETFSVDVAVLNTSRQLKIMALGLVQSSDPGQFGVDKAATNGAIRKALNDYRSRTGSTLSFWGIVDGIGYAENPNGTIYPMLGYFDYFVQHNSAYKAVLGAGQLGLCDPVAVSYDMSFYTPRTRDQMHAKYGASTQLLHDSAQPPSGTRAVLAGRATVWVR